MDDLDRELRAALARKQPPPGISARVLARVEAETEGRRWKRWWRLPSLAWAAAAIVLICAMAGPFLVHRHQERDAGQEAARQAVLALRIAGSKLQLAQTKVQQLSEKD